MLIPTFSPIIITSAYDSDAQAYFNAMSVGADDTRKDLINDLVVSLKADSIYSKLRWLSLLAAHDAQAGRINLITPSEVATTVNSPTFTTDRGYTGDGAGALLDTGVAGTALTDTDCSMFAYVRTRATTGTNIIGYESSRGRIVHSTASTNAGGSLVTNSNTIRTGTASSQFVAVRRTGTSQTTSIDTADGTANNSIITNTTGQTNTIRFLGSPTSSSNTQLGVAGFGQFLTTAERDNLRTHLITYLTAISAL